MKFSGIRVTATIKEYDARLVGFKIANANYNHYVQLKSLKHKLKRDLRTNLMEKFVVDILVHDENFN